MKIRVPVSVVTPDGRVKLNVSPGSRPPQIVLLNVPPDLIAEFHEGALVDVTIEPVG